MPEPKPEDVLNPEAILAPATQARGDIIPEWKLTGFVTAQAGFGQ